MYVYGENTRLYSSVLLLLSGLELCCVFFLIITQKTNISVTLSLISPGQGQIKADDTMGHGEIVTAHKVKFSCRLVVHLVNHRYQIL